MKKMIAIATAVLLGGAVAVQAQDTTSYKRTDSTSVTTTEQQVATPSTQLKDMTSLKSTEIPATLRESLQAPQYKGWDAATSKIYRNQTSDLYVVQIQDGTMTKTYRFDKEGKPIND